MSARRNAAAPLALAAILLVAATPTIGCSPAYPPPPDTRVEEVVDVMHGVEIHDPFRWLEDRDGPDTRKDGGDTRKSADNGTHHTTRSVHGCLSHHVERVNRRERQPLGLSRGYHLRLALQIQSL